MENWGLITYREQYLIGEKTSHPRDILNILTITAHELAHQFFGERQQCLLFERVLSNVVN